MMEEMNSTMICCKNFCKCHTVPYYNNNKKKNSKIAGVWAGDRLSVRALA
jgi:hypothetical protein